LHIPVSEAVKERAPFEANTRAALMLERGYDVHGTSRDAQASSFAKLARLGIRDQVTLW
jgi:GDP-D-mannose dehydratase